MSDDSSPDTNIETFAHLAAERPVEFRSAFLRELCPDKKTLRAAWTRLNEMVPQEEKMEFPEEEVKRMVEEAEVTQPGGPREVLPDPVGPWRIRFELGGTPLFSTFFAEREDKWGPQRAVLKLSDEPLSKKRRKEARERFTNELDVLTQLKHPNVVSLLDGGVTDPVADDEQGKAWRAYFVLEYVPGVPMQQYCDAKGLGVEPRLRLFRELCKGVAYSHRNLIIHRDLKPSDAMVVENDDADAPHVKLLRAGLEMAMQGAHGDTAGLRRLEKRDLDLRYTSPELVKDELVTTATDVYSLGVLFCKLLTRNVPYDDFWEQSIPQIAKTIATGSVRPISAHVPRNAELPIEETHGISPRALRDMIAGDLDAIGMRALRTDPANRYPSAAEMGRDVERFLNGQPVEARRLE